MKGYSSVLSLFLSESFAFWLRYNFACDHSFYSEYLVKVIPIGNLELFVP